MKCLQKKLSTATLMAKTKWLFWRTNENSLRQEITTRVIPW